MTEVRSGRPRRVADQILRELAVLVSREVRDPRVGLVTLTGAEISPDFSHATIFFSCLQKDEAEKIRIGLTRASGFLRSQLGRRIRLQVLPQLHFIYDESIDRGDRVGRLIASVLPPDGASTDT